MSDPLSHENISQRAYDIWEARGRPESDGRAEWEEAVRQIRAELRPSNNSAATGHRSTAGPPSARPLSPSERGRGPLVRWFDRLMGR